METMIGCLQSVSLFEYVSIGTFGGANSGASRRHVQMRSLFENMQEPIYGTCYFKWLVTYKA